MSEDKDIKTTDTPEQKSDARGSSRAVTSDAKNSSSAYAGYKGISRRDSSLPSADDIDGMEDDILELIRQRKGSRNVIADTSDPYADSPDLADEFDDLLDFDFSGSAEDDSLMSKNSGTIEIKHSDLRSHGFSESDAGKFETKEIGLRIPEPAGADNEVSEESVTDEELPESDTAAGDEPVAPEDKAALQEKSVSDEERKAHEDAASDEETAAQEDSVSGEETITQEDTVSDEETAAQEETVQDEDAASQDDAVSDLEKELAEDFAQNKDKHRSVKRYGFKPYTRELQAEEIRALQEASENAETAAAAGDIKKMSKGTGQKKKNSSASGTAKTSKVDKSAKTAKKNPSGAASKSSGSSGKPKNSSGKASKSGSQKNKQASGKPKSSSSSGSGAVKGKKAKPKKKWVGFIRAFVRTIIIFGVIAVLAAAGYTANIISHAPTIHPRNIYDTLDVSTHIYDDQENLVDEIYYSENRQIVTYEQLPENLKNAFIAVEDKTFWTHKGFNFKRIIGAILERFKGGRISGTSTITQQLARNVFLPEDKSVRSIKRKIIEMYYAYEIEQELSKEDIITAYLNTIYLGYGCYGVDTAAKTYFSTDVENLTLEQCAALAALPQAPGTYSLLVTEPSDYTTEYKNGVFINDASQDRRNMILNMMLQQGLITQEEKDAATKPLADFINPGSTESAASQSAFKDYVIETVKRDLMDEYGIEEDQAIKIIYTKGLNIYTTMDSQAQQTITEQFAKKKNFPSTVNGKGTVESAMVVSEVGTGEIKAMVGTRSATGQMLFNRATNPRQPGSSIKPLSVYAPALQRSLEYEEQGKTFKFKDTGFDNQGKSGWGDYITVSSLVIDEKMTVKGQTWPLNVTRSYSGRNTFRTAIQKSINTCSVKILSQIGVDYSMDTLKRFGITSAIDDPSQSVNDLNLAALGLGAMSYGISPLEMSLAYAAFPNGGVVNTPICYTKVEDSSGRTLLESRSETTRVLDEGVAWIMVDVLQSVVTDGIAKNAKVDGIKVGGKTGTTDDRYDIWFNGFTPTYSVALWIGTDDNVQMDSASEKAAALWSKIVGKIDRAKEGKYKKMPDNVFRAWNGEYYTDGTAPPEPPPEPEPEEEKEGEAPAADPNAPAPAPAPAAPPAPAPEAPPAN